uniref:Putative LOC100201425 [Hydra vulgaris] n=1 Tax=Lepeophtheirus salmonis TaxID=72036 RepID=A0A0K2TBJ6_LEPSM
MFMNNTYCCFYIILSLCVAIIVLIETANGFKLRIAQFQVSNKKSAGMDGGFLGFLNLGGGEFRIKICNEMTNICCETLDPLETQNNDWEQSEINFFIGRQLQDCENFEMTGCISLTMIHEGNDGGELENVTFYGSDFGYGENNRQEYICPIRVKLDGYNSIKVACTSKNNTYDPNRACNGDERFCHIPFSRFTFFGTHNAGTGEDISSISKINCAFKNQDLNVREQLDFGVRFFDLDIIQSKNLYNCDGLESGHGKYPELGLYRCFGKLEIFVEEMINWLNEMNNRDVVVLYFGAIDFEESTYPALEKLLKVPLINERLNKDYKTNKKWPTLGKAIGEKNNIFIFMRTNNPIDDKEFHREVPFHKKHKQTLSKDDIIITSTYKDG